MFPLKSFNFNLFYSHSLPEPNTSSKGDEDQNEPLNRDQMVYEYFSKRFDELFHEKCKAESKVINFVTEVRPLPFPIDFSSQLSLFPQCDSLRSNIELLVEDVEEKDRALRESHMLYTRLEEDFVTTRVNYEEQICVLTDQVLHLSDQLASR